VADYFDKLDAIHKACQVYYVDTDEKTTLFDALNKGANTHEVQDDLIADAKTVASLEELVGLANAAIAYARQSQELITATAGGSHWPEKYYAFKKAYIQYVVDSGKQLSVTDVGGCTCKDLHEKFDDDCLYHWGASLQPDNHRIPANCPTYWDGCNCNDPEWIKDGKD
jgi:2-methylaconitate cis-trans-isomerase PrpF